MDTYTSELLAEVKALRKEVAELRKPTITRTEIMAIKDPHRRHALIRENLSWLREGKEHE